MKFEFSGQDQSDFTLRSAVNQAIGAASVCWEHPEKAGVFQSDLAKAIGDALMGQIERFMQPKSNVVETTFTALPVCPRCGSPTKNLYPALQAESAGVLVICPDPWHDMGMIVQEGGTCG